MPLPGSMSTLVTIVPRSLFIPLTFFGLMLAISGPALHAQQYQLQHVPLAENPLGVVTGDFDRDGIIDIAACSNASPDEHGESAVYYIRGIGSGLFANAARVPSLGCLPSGGGLESADFNGDGLPDLAMFTFTGRPASPDDSCEPQISVFPGNGSGPFDPPIATAVPEISGISNSGHLFVHDFNGDGTLDLLVGRLNYVLMAGQGDGHFSYSQPYLETRFSGDAVSVDLNNDGHRDLAGPGFPQGISVFLGSGDGTFSAPIVTNAGKGPYLVAADFDENGDPDLVSVDYNPPRFSLLTGRGDGAFELFNEFPLETIPTGAMSHDLNRDGHMDVVLLGYSGEITVFNGKGNGEFVDHLAGVTLNNGLAIRASDMNQDGYDDLVTTSSTTGISVLLGGNRFQEEDALDVVPQGRDYPVTILMDPYVHPDSVVINYRRAGRMSYQTKPLTLGPGIGREKYTFIVPRDFLGLRGFQYYTRAYFQGSIESGQVRQVRVLIDDVDLADGQSRKYQLMSCPLESENGLSILGVVADDLGGIDNSRWRLLSFQTPQSNYEEFPNADADSFQRGRGYWLISSSDREIDLSPAQALSPPMEAFEYTFYPGWNQIGNPFSFSIAWGDVAPEELSLEPPVGWSEEHQEYLGETDSTILEPFQGYWVFNNSPEAVSLSFPPLEASPGLLAPNADRPRGADSWRVQIVASTERDRDSWNVIGVSGDALQGNDSLDRTEPPNPPGRALKLSLLSPGREGWIHQRSVDIRPSLAAGVDGTEGHAWTFDVQDSPESIGEEVILVFKNLEGVPPAFKCVLRDRALSRTVDLRATSVYRFSVDRVEGQPTIDQARFEIMIGTSAYIEASTRERIDGLSNMNLRSQPNPFLWRTVIRFRNSFAGRTHLSAFDVTGRKVRTLIDEVLDAGLHELSWSGQLDDGREALAGVYFLRLQTPDGFESMKILKIK